MDGLASRLFIMVISAKKTTGPHIQFLASVGAVLNNEDTREKVIEAKSREELVSLLRKGKV
jgi:mannitol/fructose-specific phosphotransferase system IIA component (Ntr-type)